MFSLMPSSHTGIKFKNLLKETPEFNILTYGYLYNGGGVAIGDINNDGLPDIYFTGSMVGSRLYLNKGNFEFEEIAQKAGVFAEGLWNTGTTMADVNGDGLLDIYVCRSASLDDFKRKNLLFINNGNLTFTEKAEEYGIADPGYSTQAAFFDYDKDGDLDLYVVNHSVQEYARFQVVSSNLKKQRDARYEDRLYKNENGKYKVVNDEAGLTSNVLGFGLGIAISDINNDNWPDIYISNDFNEQDYLYINNKNGTFTESLSNFIGHTSHFSMGSDIADINNDGFSDIITLDMWPERNDRQKMVSGPDNYEKYLQQVKNDFYQQTMRNMLHINNQGKSFSEIGQYAGISATDWSWSSLFCDLDNDGFKDIYITNGVKKDYTNMDFMNFAVQEKMNESESGIPMSIDKLLENIPATLEENYTFRNNRNLTFTKVNADWGLNKLSLSSGAAYADLDNDGDLDLVVNNTDAEAFVYRNNSNNISQNNYLKVCLKGEGKNTFGIGAKVILTVGNEIISQELMPTRGFQSSVDYGLVFGVGKENSINELKVIWPDGKLQILKNIKANQALTLNQKEGKIVVETKTNAIIPYFNETIVAGLEKFIHQENDFVDFYQQTLLPHKLSIQGPKIAVADVNLDGLEDVFIGGALGKAGSLFIQSNSGKFIEKSMAVFEQDKNSEDIDLLFFDADGDKDLDLYVVSGGNESLPNAPELQDRLYLNDGKGNFTKMTKSLPAMLVSGSCVKAADFDSDGDLDLFVGGRVVPNSYPIPGKSYILENDGKGNFKDATQQICSSLSNIGMVTDAIWTDFDGNGAVDLIIVGEFMPIRFFENINGKLQEVNGILDSEGWWNTIEAGDFDHDGDMDYIVGNFGLNTQLKANKTEPISLYAKDFDKNGSIDPILCAYNLGVSYPIFSKDDISSQLSMMRTKYVSYSSYASQTINDLFTEKELKGALKLEAKRMESCYLENLGNKKFKLSPLPFTAQIAPIHAILINDFNNDGHLDAVLGGNFFGTRVKYGRYDANKGVLLLGNGKGGFAEVNVEKSGVNLDGEVRDIKTIKSANGTQKLIFARNSASLSFFEWNKK
jgi:enediyne biosynthesis protein E4